MKEWSKYLCMFGIGSRRNEGRYKFYVLGEIENTS